MNALLVRHIPQSEPPQFQVTRLPDGKTSGQAIEIPSPASFPVQGRPQSNLLRETQWYLETFLDYPFPPETDHASRVQDALRAWGMQAFDSLFGDRAGGRLFDGATSAAYTELHLQISSDDPRVLGWPWEALYDPEVGYLAQTCQIERRLNQIRDVQKLPESLPRDRVNILLVTARPYQGDVQYRSISRPLVELIARNHLPAHVDVLRPPTIARLRDHLRERPGYYHILHFDGHGAYGQISGASGPFTLQGPQGALIFEKDDGQLDPINADQLSVLLRECAVPAVVLNACQSAMVDDRAEDQFASVAAALLRSGMRSVVAMAYSLYVSGAQQFLPAFYRRLFEEGSVAQAVRAGRQAMLQEPGRVCVRGTFPLDDWLVPVLYQQEPLDFSFAKAAAQAKDPAPSKLPAEVLDNRDPYGFVGRDGPLLELERAMRRPPPAILIQGLGGVGKTTLARGFLQWLDATNGLGEGSFWFWFQEIRSAEYVFNRMGEALFGGTFATVGVEDKINGLAQAFHEHHFVIVWDNFEVVRGIPGTHVTANLSAEDRDLLARFLDKLRGGATNVIITSRSPEDWLGHERRFLLPLGGLEGEERWEYCTAILRDLGKTINRDDKDLVELMKLLGGHPLAMRAILPRLERLSAAEVARALRTNLAALGSGVDDAQAKMTATLAFVEQSLPEDLRPLLIPLAMHEGFAFAGFLEQMAKAVDANWSRERIDRLLQILVAAGLVRDLGLAVYELHPALTGFLRSNCLDASPAEIRDPWARAFVDVMGRLADRLAPKELHEQRTGFQLLGASFYFALGEAERLGMDQHLGALIQSLAAYAQNIRDYRSASDLFRRLGQHHQTVENFKGEASAYHQLGMIAQEQRDFSAAEQWYRKSLAIEEKQGNEHGAAGTYHQLGIIAEEQRDFSAAEQWYRKSLAIEEKHGNEHGAALTYGQLGNFALEQNDLKSADEWYRKSLAITEKQGNEDVSALTYHQLGRIAQEQRDFSAAEQWYRKSLDIKEKHGNEHGAASTYHQLGRIAKEQRDFSAAEQWYRKSLAIEEKQGNEHGAASTYHQLGRIAQEQGDFSAAEQWYRKSLVISEKQGNEHYAASTYHQLGMNAQEQRDFSAAEQWYRKSLAIKEKQGNEHGAASTYHQLGSIAQEQRDFSAAEQWYRKSLAIKEKHGNEHGAASTYGQLGILAGLQEDWMQAGSWEIRSIVGYIHTNDEAGAKRITRNFQITFRSALPAEQAKLKGMWEQAGLGAFPEEQGT